MTEFGIHLGQDHGVTAAQARRIFVLRRGERRIVRCGRRVVRIRRFFLRPGEVLVVICGRGRHRQTFIFVCRGRGFPENDCPESSPKYADFGALCLIRFSNFMVGTGNESPPFLLLKLRQIFLVGFQHFIQDFFGGGVGRDERIDGHGKQGGMVVAGYGGFGGNPFEGFNLLDEASDGDGQVSDGDGFGAACGDDAVDFDGGIVGDAGDGALIFYIDGLDVFAVMINGVDQVAGGITVVSAAALCSSSGGLAASFGSLYFSNSSASTFCTTSARVPVFRACSCSSASIFSVWK